MVTSWVQICKEVSKELGIPEQEIKDEILRYTKDCREAATEMRNLEIYLFGLGVLRVSKPVLKDYIRKLGNRIDRLTTKEFSNKEQKLSDYLSRLEHLKFLKEKSDSVFKQRKFKLRKRV